MLVSVINSKHSFLESIWLTSLLLGLISIAIMLFLIIRHAVIEGRRKKISVRKKEIANFLLAAVHSPVDLTKSNLPPLRKRDFPTLMKVALVMLRSLQGDYIQRIVKILILCDMQSYFSKMAIKGVKNRRIQALTIFRYFSDEDSLKILLQCVRDKDINVQITALHSLALRDSEKYLDQIIEGISNSSQTNIMMLADILRRFGENAVPSFIKLVNLHANLKIRIAAIIALGDIRSFKAVDDLVKFMGDSNIDIRLQSVVALGKIGDERCAKIIANHLEKDEALVRIEAATALGKLRDISTMPQLINSLNDKNWWVRFSAAKSICDFGDKGVAILRSIGNQDNDAGLIANQVLSEFVEA